MTRSVVVSLRLGEELAARVERLAGATRRSEATLLAEAVELYVAEEEAYIAAVEEGRRASRDGELTENAIVFGRIRRMLGTEGG